MKSNLIKITKIYDIYPKYTFSKDVRRFMDEIVDIKRENVIDIAVLDEIRVEVEALPKTHPLVNNIGSYVNIMDVYRIIDKYKTESER